MTKNTMYQDSASLSKTPHFRVGNGMIPHAEACGVLQERMLKYKTMAVAFSYPDNKLFEFFPQFKLEQEKLSCEYDRLFRANEIWLFGTEYMAENEFQRTQILADINGFYRAFGLETDSQRPDFVPCELEFMHYLIFKEMNAPDKQKVSICQKAQKKFFSEHLYPAAKKIADRIIQSANSSFYKEISEQLLGFVESEDRFLNKTK